MITIPEQAVAGMRTQLRFTIDPADGLEKYLGAWAHMLAASDDLIDMMHAAPFRVDEHKHGRVRGRVSRDRRPTACGFSSSDGRRQYGPFDVPVKSSS